MTKIKIMSVRDEDIVYIEDWAKQNSVEYELSRHPLTDDNICLLYTSPSPRD